MSSSRQHRAGLVRWTATAMVTVAGGLLAAGPVQAAAEPTTTTKAPGATTTTAKAAGGATATTKVAGATAANEGSAFGVSVDGGATLGARPAVRIKSCPDDQAATLATAESASFLLTGSLDVRAACTTADGLQSRSVVNNVEVGPAAPARLMKAKAVAAECRVKNGVVSGAVVIGGLEGAGKIVGDLKNPDPGTQLSTLIPGLSGVVNEQVTADGYLSVNAMRIKLGAVDIVIGHVECGTGASDGEKATAAGTAKTTTTSGKATTTTVGGPTTTKVKGSAKDDGEATSTTVASPTTKVATPTTKVAVVKAESGKNDEDDDEGEGEGEDLAKTGPIMGGLLVLALGALGMGAAMRFGPGGVGVLVRSGRGGPVPRAHIPAKNWRPLVPNPTDGGRLDAAATDALRDLDGDSDRTP